jgi:nicotinate phosphoribosyltransferase
MEAPRFSPLLTDQYQLTMLQGYLAAGMTDTAVFEFFSRKLRAGRRFLLAAGLEQALDYLESLRFSAEEIDWLASTGTFKPVLLDYLRELRFTGDVDAVPEGTPMFPDEPILRVIAPLPQAQLVETRIINLLQFQTMVATKAARVVLAAPEKLLVDFGLRRAHGGEAGLLAARAAYLAGFAGSATVLAEALYGVPAYGTVAHSFVQAHDGEEEAFLHQARAQPEGATFLIDTYDTEAAAEKIVRLVPRLRAMGAKIRAVRIDSGDLGDHARKVRRILDRGGLSEVRIFASGSLDEHRIRAFEREGVPIDGYGVGSRLTTSADDPYLDCAYKLQEYAGRARRKRSEGKATWPGRKQVYRHRDGAGRAVRDVLTLADDPQEGEPLLRPVMRNGRRLGPSPPLAEVRERAAAAVASLPEGVKDLDHPEPYPVEVTAALRALADAVDREVVAAAARA